jgi:lactate dehydrogenase-like 2-hydroxyacid dehydrogenase
MRTGRRRLAFCAAAVYAAAMKPTILPYPGLGAFESLFGAHYDILKLPGEAADRAAALAAQGAKVEAAVVIGSIGLPASMMAALPKLRLIACFGVGYDGVDLAAARDRGIAVTNCPNINHEDVADVALGLLISCIRNIAAGDRAVRGGAWKSPVTFPPPRRLRGRRLGIVGLGAIGDALALRAAACGMDIAWTGPRPKSTPWRHEPDLLALAEWCDVLAMTLRPDPGTEKMVDARVLEALGAEGVVINVSRGSVIDEDALIAALKEGRIAGAGLDVFAQEPSPAERWADVPNTTLTPHFGGGTRESIMESAELVLENLRRHFAGEPLATRVN